MKGFTRERVALWIINCSLLWMAFFDCEGPRELYDTITGGLESTGVTK